MKLLHQLAESLGKPIAVAEPTAAGLPLAIARFHHNEVEVEFDESGTVGLVMQITDKQYVQRKFRGVWSHRPSGIGAITVTDPARRTKFVSVGDANVLTMLLPTELFAAVPGMIQEPAVRARFNEPSPGLERCAQRAMVALHTGEVAEPLVAESIALQLAVRVVEDGQAGESNLSGGLPSWRLRRVEDLVEGRMAAQAIAALTLDELAAEAGLSRYHFARVFRRTVGMTPYAYVLRKRLRGARRLLSESNLPIAEVGRRFGFEKPSHFSRSFRLEMDVAPGAYRRAVRDVNS